MHELTESGRGVVESLLSAPVAWQTPAELSRATGLGFDELGDLLASLDVGGWLAAWEREADVVVTLSVAAASSLGVRLVEIGPEEIPRWARAGDREPPPPKAPGVFRSDRAAMLELVVDRAPSAELAAERAEDAAPASRPPGSRRGPSADDLPKPTHYLGGRLSPWPGPSDGRKGACPSCHSGPLTPTSYCLYCDRWGLDHLLLDLPSPPKAIRRDRRDDVRRKDMERLARKEKRRARRNHQADAERQLRASKTRNRPSTALRDRCVGAPMSDRDDPNSRAFASATHQGSTIP